MSLRDDVMEREKKRQEAASQPGTPASKRGCERNVTYLHSWSKSQFF